MGRSGHLPLRTCVVCGRKASKPTLLRMAVDEKNSIVPDRDQLLEGRGAYVCPGCLPRLRFTKRLKKAFRDRATGLATNILEELSDR